MPTFESIDWYEQARCYDIIFDAETKKEADFLEAVGARFGPFRGRRVLEPACGTGRLVAEMAKRGWKVTGFDICGSALEYARSRLARRRLSSSLFRAEMQSFRLPADSFDFAHCLVSTFKYLMTEADARAHLRAAARTLTPGGVYVLGLHLTDYADRRCNRERWIARRGGTEVVCNIQGWPPDPVLRTERVRARLIATSRSRERRFETNWTFRTYDVDELRTTLRAAPALEHVATFDFHHDIDQPRELDGQLLDAVLVLRKRAT